MNTEKLRICYFAPHGSIHTVRWLSHFVNLGHQVFLFTGIRDGFKPWPIAGDGPAGSDVGTSDEISEDARVVRRNWFRTLSRVPLCRDVMDLAWLWWVVRRHAKKICPDVVHAFWLWDNACLAAMTGVRPFLLTPMGSDIYDVHQLSVRDRLFLKTALFTSDAVTSGAQDLLDICMVLGARRSRCRLIAAPGIDIAKFEKPEVTGLFSRLGIPDKAEIVLSCRAMQEFYHIHTIVDAFRAVKAQRPSSVLLVLNFNGHKDYFERIQRQIAVTGLSGSIYVHAAAYNEMPEIYARSSVAVSLPETDAIPQSGYEAFAAGCPYVATDLSCYNGFMDHGRTVMRVKPDDAQGVADAILVVLSDDSLRKRLIANGREAVKSRGDIHAEMAKMEALYYDLIQPRRGKAESEPCAE